MSRPLALVNGDVRTMDARGTVAEAVYLAGGRIAAVGPTGRIAALAGEDAAVVDLAGRTAFPGLIDAHAHMISLGLLERILDARYPGVDSLAALVDAVGDRAERVAEGAWVRGRGFDHAKYPESRSPTRWDIDPVTPQNPVFLVHVTGHHALVNTRALDLAGVDDRVRDPKGGHFVRDERGRLTGMLMDAAMQVVAPVAVDVGNHGPNHLTFPSSRDELVDDIDRGSRAFLSVGVTTIVDPQVTRREMFGYLDARRRGRLHVRTRAMYLSNHLDDLVDLGLGGPLGDDRLGLGPLKIYCDGALLGASADFYEPYRTADDRRSAFWSAAEIAELLGRAHAFGLQVGVHAQGDRAIKHTVDAIEAAQASDGDSERRHRIEHCGCPRHDELCRMKTLGIVPIAQPGFVYQAGDELAEALGPERAARLMPLRTELELGLHPVISSDTPVGSHNPWHNIYAAVSRHTLSGAEVGGEERISLDDAIRAHTIHAARSIHAEDSLGSLEVGKLADVTVLDRDLADTPERDLRDVAADLTVLGGEIAHSREAALQTR